MKFSGAIAAVFVSSGLAAPLSSTTYDANYDDIVVTPGVPAANTLTTYKGLYYQGFAVNQFTTAVGLVPSSKPNAIVSGVQQTATSGRAGVSTQNTKTKSFDLKSLYYGCVINSSEGAAGTAQSCTFDVQGFRNLNDPTASYVAIQRLTFNHAVTTVSQPMSKATLNSAFKNLQRVDIVQVESTSGEALNVVVLDDLVYTVYQ